MPATLEIGSPAITRRLFAVGIIGFLTALSVGVDGHAIFQILAAESLGLGPRAVGIAMGLGVLSIPVQIWAARIPLQRARHNVRIFLHTMGVMALATAALVAFAEPGSWVAGLALVIAVAAEISVSVLLATAWQPLISYSLTTTQRQFMLGPAAASTMLVVLVCTALVGVLDRTGHAVFVALIGVVALAVAETLPRLPPPPDAQEEPSPPSDEHDPNDARRSDPDGVRNIYLLMPLFALARWPLLVTYAAVVLWPDGNLGLLGAAISAGGIITSLLWRDPGRHLLTAIRVGAVTAAACTAGLIMIDGPVTTTGTAVWLLLLVTLGSAARNVTGTAVMELSHRRIDTTNSVRVMTMIDVIGSTSAQAGMFVAGFLIAWSIAGSAGHDLVAGFDVYQLWLIVTGAALVAGAARLRLRPGDVTVDA